MNRAAVAGQKRVIAQAVILNVRLEQLAVVLDNDFRLPDEPEDTFAQHLAFPVFFLCLAEQGLNKCLNFPEFFAFSAEELIENQGFTVFDNFTLCSTQNPREKSPGFFFAVFCPFLAASLKIGHSARKTSLGNRPHMRRNRAKQSASL